MLNRRPLVLITTSIFLLTVCVPFVKAETQNSFVEIENKNLLSDDAIKRLNDWAGYLLKDLDVEFVTIVKETLAQEPINDAANRYVAERKIGHKTKGRKGLLLLIAVKERLVRFEVGYDLESVLPDAFIHYIERDQMTPFFEEGKIGQGIEATVEMIITKLYQEIKRSGYDPKAKNEVQLKQFSGGGGAKENAAIGVRTEPLRMPANQNEKEYFKPGKSPAETHEKYLESCRRQITATDLDIYSDKDKEFFKKWTVTPAQLRNYLNDFEGEPFKTEIKDDLAVLVYPANKRHLMPVFLKKERGGWVLDFYTQNQCIKFNQKNHWFLVNHDNPYMFALNKYFDFDQQGHPHFKNRRKQ